MKYFLKFLALMGLTGAMVYSLFIHGDISSYGFWLWTLVISVSLITLGNYASLIGALNCKMNDQDEDEKGLLILSTFLSSLIFSTIFFYSISAENPDWIYLLCSFISVPLNGTLMYGYYYCSTKTLRKLLKPSVQLY